MSYQQLIAGKVKLNGLEGIRRHLQERERVKTNPNIDLSRSHLNYCIEDLTPDHLSQRVKERIAQLHLKKRPRSDAVGIEDIIVSASVDFMLQLDCDAREQYFRDSLHFFQNRYKKQKAAPKKHDLKLYSIQSIFLFRLISYSVWVIIS